MKKLTIKRVKKKENKNIEKLNEYISLLYENPIGFLNRIDEMKAELKNKEDFFDFTDISIFSHYFMAMKEFKRLKNVENYNILDQNHIKFLLNFESRINLQDSNNNSILHFLAKLNEIDKLIMIIKNLPTIDINLLNNQAKTFLMLIDKNSTQLSCLYECIKNIDADNVNVKNYETNLSISLFKYYQYNNKFDESNIYEFHENLRNLSVQQLQNLLYIKDIKYNIIREYFELNLSSYIENFIDIIEKIAGPSFLQEIILDFRLHISYCVKKGNFQSINKLLFIYSKCKLTINLFVDDHNYNIYHGLGQNYLLSLEEKKLLLHSISNILNEELSLQLLNSPDNLGNLPLIFFLSNEKYFKDGYEILILDNILNQTNLDKFKSQNKSYDFLNRDVKVRKKDKIYLTHPSESLINCTSDSSCIYLLNYLSKNQILKLEAIDKKTKLSILSILISKKFMSSNVYSLIASFIDYSNPLMFSNNRAYFSLLDSYMKLNVLIYNYNYVIPQDISNSLTIFIDNITTNRDVLQSSSIKNKKMKRILLEDQIKHIKYVKFSMIKKYSAFLKNIENFNTFFNTIESNKDDENLLKKNKQAYINLFKSSIDEILKTFNKKEIDKTLKLCILEVLQQNKYIYDKILKMDIINYLNIINNYGMFKNVISPLFNGVSQFKGYELINYILQNVNEDQASYLVRYLKESEIIKSKFFDQQNPLLIFQNLNNFCDFVYNYSCTKNIYYFFEITKLIFLSSINLRNLIDLYFCYIVNHDIVYLKNHTTDRFNKKFKLKENNKYNGKSLTFFTEFIKRLDIIFPKRESVHIKLANSFLFYCVYVLNVSQNDKIIKNLYQIAEYGNFKELASAVKRAASRKRNFLNEYTEYENEKYQFKISQNMVNDIQFQSTFSKQMQLKLTVFNRNLKSFLERTFINNNFSWLSIISFNQHISTTIFFFNCSFFYTNLFPESIGLNKKLFITNYYIDNIVSLFNKDTRKIKQNLNENEQILLMKNFIFDFNVESNSLDSLKIIDQIKKKLKMILHSSNNLSINFLKLPEIHLLFNINRDLKLDLENLMTLYIGGECLYGYIQKEDLLMYAPLAILRIMNANSVIFLNDSNLITINIWVFLYIKREFRDKDSLCYEVKKISQEIMKKRNPIYFCSDNDKIHRKRIILEEFLENIDIYNDLINELVQINNYFKSSFALTVYNVIKILKREEIFRRKEDFFKLIEICSNYNLINHLNSQSERLYMHVLTLYSDIESRILKEIPKHIYHFKDILSSILSSLDSYKDKFSNVINILAYTIRSLLKMRNTELFEYFIENLILLNPICLKQIYKQSSISNILLMYFVFKDNCNYLKEAEQYIGPQFYLDPFILDNHYLIKSIFIRNNNFTKFISKYSNTNLIYLSILYNSTSILHHVLNKTTFSEIKSYFLSNINQVKIGLNLSLLISKNKQLIHENLDIFTHDIKEITYICKNFKDQNDYSIINKEYYVQNSLTLIENSIIHHNLDFFKYLFEILQFKQNNFLENLYSRGINIIHLVIENNEYRIFSYIIGMFDDDTIKHIASALYIESKPALHIAAYFKAYEIFVLLIPYFSNKEIYQTIISQSYFLSELLINVNKNKQFYELNSKNIIKSFSILQGIKEIFIEFYNDHNELINSKTNYLEFSKHIMEGIEETELLKLSNLCSSTIERILNIIFSYLFVNRTLLDEHFILLLTKHNDKKLSRFILYIFLIELNILPSLEFFDKFLEEHNMDETILIDFYFYLEKLGFPLLNISHLYEKLYLGKNFESLTKLENIKSIDKEHVSNIKLRNISIFKDTYKLIKESFLKNEIKILLQIKNYPRLLLHFYSYKQFTIDGSSILNESLYLKQDICDLVKYYFNKTVLITQQLKRKELIFEFISLTNNENEPVNQDNENKSINEDVPRIKNKIHNDYCQIFEMFCQNNSKIFFNSQFFEKTIYFNYFITGNFSQIISAKNLNDLHNLFKSFTRILSDIVSNELDCFIEFFDNHRPELLYFSEFNINTYINKMFTEIINKIQVYFLDQGKSKHYKVDINVFNRNYDHYFTLYSNTKSYFKITTRNDILNDFIMKYLNFFNFISYLISTIYEIELALNNLNNINNIILEFEILDSHEREDTLRNIREKNINNILNSLPNNNEIHLIIPIEIESEYFDILDSFFKQNLFQSIKKITSMINSLMTLQNLTKDDILFFINPIKSFSNKDNFTFNIFWDNYTDILKIKYDFFFYNFNRETGNFRFIDAEKEEIINTLFDYIDSSVGISSMYNLTKTESHFSRNLVLKSDLEDFVNELSNYEIFFLRNYLEDFFENRQISHEYKKYNSDTINVFYSHDKFIKFFDLIFDRITALKNINLKFDNIELVLDFHKIESILSEFISTNSTIFRDNFNNSVLYNIFYSKYNSIWYLIEFLVELSLNTDDRILNFKISFKSVDSMESSVEKYSPINLNPKDKERLGIIERLLIVNSVSISRLDENMEEFIKLEIELYSNLNISGYGPNNFILTDILNNRDHNNILNQGILKHFCENEELREKLVRGIKGNS